MTRRGLPRRGIRKRNAASEQQYGRDGRHLQTLEVGKNVEVVARQRNVVGKRQPGDEIAHALEAGGEVEHWRIGRQRDRGLGQADLEDDEEGDEEEGDQPEIGHGDDEAGARGKLAGTSRGRSFSAPDHLEPISRQPSPWPVRFSNSLPAEKIARRFFFAGRS
jgi:hypothetical protein